MDVKPADGSPAVQTGGIAQLRTYFADAAAAAAKFLARPDGPRVGALAFDGWDTHINEGAVKGRLADLLGALDGALAAVETSMGEAWRGTDIRSKTRPERSSASVRAAVRAPPLARASGSAICPRQ